MPTYTFPTNIAVGDLGQVTWANSISSALNTLGPLVDTKANDNAVVKTSGNQTVAGVKTFSSAPSVPDSSFSIAKTTGLQSALDAKVAQTRTVAGKALSSDVTLTEDDISDGSVNRKFTATEKTKLSGVATGATSNDSDANLKNRANHTGTQLSSTISDFAETARDIIGTALVAGANITLDVNDAGDTITITSAGGTGTPGDGSITTIMLADDSVTSAKIVNGTIVDEDVSATAAIAQSKVSGLTTALSAKAPLASPTFTGTVSGVTKVHVGLSNVDNTSDANKPVSTATQAALNSKAPLASPAFTGTPTGITKTHVGLSNVDNTSDANKPISTTTQSALDEKISSNTINGVEWYATSAELPSPGVVGVIYFVDAV